MSTTEHDDVYWEDAPNRLEALGGGHLLVHEEEDYGYDYGREFPGAEVKEILNVATTEPPRVGAAVLSREASTR